MTSITNRTCEVVIIGGGISGTAAAYELARRGVAVTLVERSSLASMASGWTLAGVRQSGRHPAELPLAQAAVERWAHLDEELDAGTEYRRDGNLRLARTSDEVPVIAQMVEEQRALGLDLTYLPDNAAVRAVAPNLANSILAASLCPSDGHANPTKTVQAFAAAASRHGARMLTKTEFTEIDTAGGKVQGVQTTQGPIAADVVVTAGVYTDRLLRPLGLTIPLRIKLVTVVQSVPLPPLLAQVLGVANANLAGRQQVDGRLRLTGGSAPWTGTLDDWNDDAVQPPAAAVAGVITRAAEVLPAVTEARVSRVWGGLLDMTPDALPVIERPGELDGLIVAAGFSGHGFCLGPITGQIIRELVETGEPSLPLSPFKHARFAGMANEVAPTLHG